jgi:ABC-type uncharacterized transport system permease subunit
MQALALTLGAAGAYLLATLRLAVGLFRPARASTAARALALALATLGLVLHAAVLYQAVFVGGGLNLGFFNALSLTTWLVAAIVVAASVNTPLENLAVLVLPLAAVVLLLAQVFPGDRLVALNRGIGFQLHLVLAITAYSVAAVAAFQALLLAYQERQLRRRRLQSALRALPPLQTMETLLFELIAGAFFLLSLTIVSGIMFLEDMFAQHVAHKTVLSLIAWLIFAILLWGRWRFGWRGRVAIRWSLGGFVMLMLAYFGSKFVLELVLGR